MTAVDTDSAQRRRSGVRRERAEVTREHLLHTAERLFAERGLSEVSSRQIVEAAGQANNSALAYHVGTRADLLRAISRAHVEPITRRSRELFDETRGSSDPGEYLGCLVRPYTEHLASLGTPSWYARFAAQLATDPAYVGVVLWAPELAALLEDAHHAMSAHVPDLPSELTRLRYQTARLAVLHTCAEQERAAADTGVPADWELIGDALTDGITGMLLAPVRPRPHQG
ncbi:TetR/AcrR family transcriptional regulator [Actinoalloteichus hymeniacidonis]|uniref:Transcriptional regulator, TetR family n=1 Tax=Actinoalloteichus hymeniacidonis TaxID=340345 RepID=A0AAC9HRZ6_9PSEU|nr:helix-turn-helix domain-containing protein [Actinoalloteichus hymeniacidonis]AOS64507.1 transcriptional regulator, TetR family [Actinoalloteichus hymeniacidonis]MBB5907421.1 AcrR family transcriptional regulator [Actinoalloteichus hymeniacidonis]